MTAEIYPLPLRAVDDRLTSYSFTLWSRDAPQYDAAVAAALKALRLEHLRVHAIRYGDTERADEYCTAHLSDGRVLTLFEVDGTGASAQTNFIDD